MKPQQEILGQCKEGARGITSLLVDIAHDRSVVCIKQNLVVPEKGGARVKNLRYYKEFEAIWYAESIQCGSKYLRAQCLTCGLTIHEQCDVRMECLGVQSPMKDKFPSSRGWVQGRSETDTAVGRAVRESRPTCLNTWISGRRCSRPRETNGATQLTDLMRESTCCRLIVCSYQVGY